MRKNKKFYNFTPAQKRRDRFVPTWRSGSVPWSYRHPYNKRFAAQSKQYVYKLLAGFDVEPPKFVRDAAWDYW